MTSLQINEAENQGRVVLQQLLTHGYEAYFVGGCVRDRVLNRPVNDYDIATSATPDQVISCFERTVPTGIKHGTVTVLIDHQPFEVTTFRTETEYEQFRRPKEVKYVTSLVEDLRRRDFTMNAMAMDIAGQLIDPFAGQADLKSGLLRCVGIAEERFGEDALRMLRCVRFASDYGLRVEEATWDSLRVQAPLLSHIAMERVRAELERLVGGSDPHRGIRMLVASELPQYFRQPLGLPIAARWSSAFAERALRKLTALPDTKARWVLLLLLMEEEVVNVSSALRKLTFSRATITAISSALALHSSVIQPLSQLPEDGHPVTTLETTFKLSVLAHGQLAAELWLAVITVLNSDVVSCEEEASIEVINKEVINKEIVSKEAVSEESTEVAASNDAKLITTPLMLHLEPFLQAYAAEIAMSGYEWLNTMPCTSIKDLMITGTELIAHIGKPGGPWVANELQRLLREVALGSLPNDKAALLEASKQ